MLKPLPLRVVLPAVVLLAGSVAVTAAPAAAGSAAVPSSHVKECADDGLENAGAMTLVSSASGKDTSGSRTSRARVWAYGVAGSTQRCVVVKAVGARVPRQPGRTTDYSVGHLATSDGRVVLDTGEVLPLENALEGFGGASERTHVTASVREIEETDRFSEEDAPYMPPGLIGLVGHEGTLQLNSVSVELHAQAWTTRDLAKPLSKVQRKKLRSAEVKLARERHAARLEEVTATRDEQLALAATETGLAAAWRIYMAKEMYGMARMLARASLADSVALARQHAADAGRGTLTREAYLHRIILTVPVL